jgi:hypothetical protein
MNMTETIPVKQQSNVERLRKSRGEHFERMYANGVTSGKEYVKCGVWQHLESILENEDCQLLDDHVLISEIERVHLNWREDDDAVHAYRNG